MRAARPADELWMRRALALARKGEGATRPNPPVGAVVVRGNRVVGEGWHRRAGGDHAEIHAIRQAGRRASGSTLYVTLEPCCTWGRTGPCTEAILAAGIKRVVAAVSDPNPRHRGRGLNFLRRAGVATEVGVCRDEASELLSPFSKAVTTGFPFVSLKLACSLDGRIADALGNSRWISGCAARRWVHGLRRRVDAVMVGAGTARNDDPGLLAMDGAKPRGYRVIVSSDGRLPEGLRVLTDRFADRTIVAVTGACSNARERRLSGGGAEVWRIPATRSGRVSLRALVRRLGRAGFLHVLCEGGGELAESLARQKLVDRYHFVLAGRLLGGCGMPSVAGAGWPLRRAPSLRIVGVQRLGRDVLLTAGPEAR